MEQILKNAFQDNVESLANLMYAYLETTPGDTVELTKDDMSTLIGLIIRQNRAITEML